MPDRLALVIHALNSGGAERVLASLANHWAESGSAVTLITLADAAEDAYPLHQSVQRVGLGLLESSRSRWQAISNNIARLRRLRQAIRASDADLVVSFTDNMNVLTLLASRGAGWPVVIAERNDPRRQRMSSWWERLRRWNYPACAAAVVQTETVADHLRPLVAGKPVYVIPNGVPSPPSFAGQENSPYDRPFVVAMGRLDRQKGFDLLIDAFSRVVDAHPGWDLRIIGTGADRSELEGLAVERGISDRVHFHGWLEHPQTLLRHSQLFVLSSRWEGFPNALLEAMACGIPAISFACDSGPAEIIRDGVDGVLVPPEDSTVLAAALDRLIGSPDERGRMANRAGEVVSRFETGHFFRQWDQILAKTASGTPANLAADSDVRDG